MINNTEIGIQKLTEAHYLESLKLSEYAFQYKVTDDEVEKRLESLKNHTLYGIFDENQLAAKLHLFPFKIFLGSKEVKMGGIAGVATYPEYRRNGYVKALIIHALKEMKDQGFTVSMLHPFSVSFYRKYGWELLTNQLKSTLTKSDLRMQEHAPGIIKRYNKETHNEDVEKIYNAFASRHSGMLVRPSSYWTNAIYDDLFIAVYYDTNNEPSGYILYEVKDNKMKVEEFIHLNSEARRGLWNFVCQHDSMINEISMITTEKEPLFFTLSEPRVKSEVVPYGMVRVVDVEAFLHQFPFQWHHLHHHIALKMTDSYAPWNNKTFLLAEKHIEVLDETPNQNTVQLSINALSTMLFGYRRPNELFELGMISGNKDTIEQLEALIPAQQPFIYDYF